MNKVLSYGLIGALVGLSTSYIVMTIVLLNDSSQSLTGHELLLQLCLALILGIGCGFISLIFTLDQLPYLLKLTIHYIVILVLVLICGAFGEWYESPIERPAQFMFFIFIQLFIYVIISLVVYWMDMQELNEINEKLQKRR
nr:DUF3021 domain-containing protein [Lysinibacillus timonensis]